MTTGAGTTLRTSLAAMLLAVATALPIAALPVTAQAEAPRYEPYGAWRGRIRYVEGPRRTRTHIRWGNGITPVGGQVLMHFATVAGNVATNENFLNAVAPGLRNAEVDADLVAAVNGLGTKNDELLKSLNELRQRADVNLPVLAFPAAPAGTPQVGLGNGRVIDQALLTQRDLHLETLTKNIPNLAAQIFHAAATADNVVEAMPAQQTQRAALRTFSDASFVQDIAPPMTLMPPATSEQFAEAIKSIKELQTATVGVLKELLKVEDQILNFDPTSDPDRVNKLKAEMEVQKKILADLEALTI